MSKQKQDNNFTKKLFCSAAATSVAEIITIPLCTTKTVFQTTSNISQTNIRNTVKNIYLNHGIRGFYKGTTPAVFSQMLSASGKYAVYCELKSYSEFNVLNGIVAGVSVSLLTHPIDFLRINMQINKPILSEINKNGISVIYRGYTKNLSKVCLGGSLFMPLYDLFKKKIDSPFLCSLSSSIISTSILQPVDYMKTVHVSGGKWFIGFDIRKYYRGYLLNIFRTVPHYITMMTITEFLLDV